MTINFSNLRLVTVLHIFTIILFGRHLRAQSGVKIEDKNAKVIENGVIIVKTGGWICFDNRITILLIVFYISYF